jgi:hypothetical protein
MKTVLLVSAAALALCVGGVAQAAPAMNAAGVRGTAQPVHHAPSDGMTTLYDQNTADGAYGFFSQTLSSYPQYDEYLADDFTVPSGHTWKVQEVDVTGFYYIEAGPASSVNVLFWKNNPKHGLPKGTTPKTECDNLTPISGLSTGVFGIKLPKSCKVKLAGGTSGTTYWLTVQANMKGADTSGYWAWSTNNTIAGNMGAGYWYGGSVGVNDPKCLTQFEDMLDCTGFTYDFAFALLGKDS